MTVGQQQEVDREVSGQLASHNNGSHKFITVAIASGLGACRGRLAALCEDLAARMLRQLPQRYCVV